jgi:hypothetical protein
MQGNSETDHFTISSGRMLEELLAVTGAVEAELENAGFSLAHDWMFGIREALYDLTRVQNLVFELQLAEPFTLVKEVKELVNVILYEVVPHISSHCEEVMESLPEDGERLQDVERLVD